MCRVLAMTYPAMATSVGAARRWAQRAFARWELDPDSIADAALLTSEVVTNAVLHARSPLALSLAVADGVLEVGVGDEDPRPPRRRTPAVPGAVPADSGPPGGWWLLPADIAHEGGRGLLLLDELADEWGVVSLATGKQVWFRLDAGAAWPYRTACPCAGEELGRVRLESGRQVLAVAGPWDEPR